MKNPTQIFLSLSLFIAGSTFAPCLAADESDKILIRVFEKESDDYMKVGNGPYKIQFDRDLKVSKGQPANIGSCRLTTVDNTLISSDATYDVNFSTYNVKSYRLYGAGYKNNYYCGSQLVTVNLGSTNLARESVFKVVKGRTCSQELILTSPTGKTMQLICPTEYNSLGLPRAKKEKEIANLLGDDAYLLQEVPQDVYDL